MSRMVLGQADVPFTDNRFLDRWEFPLGEWAESAVNWLSVNLSWLFDAIRWPFDQLLGFLIDPSTGIMLRLPWFVMVALVGLIGWRLRNWKIGVGSALGLVLCGLLGDEFWQFTMQTLGMIIVAVVICVIVGIPLGILAAKRDGAWAVIRPVLDAMQTIHPFVYLIPIVFFFGTRTTPGVICAMIFALPPIVRLTNLGIRQVPADVVEAARAFGSKESTVLRDVQLPLARPAIMAGLNQTLLMALSMVVIVALIAGGGLGQLILRGVNTLNVSLAVSSGVAVLIIAVILDRLSETPASTEPGPARRSLLGRIGHILSGRANREMIAADRERAAEAKDEQKVGASR